MIYDEVKLPPDNLPHRPFGTAINASVAPSMLEVPTDNWLKSKNSLTIDKRILEIIKTKKKLSENISYSFSHFDLEIEIHISNIKKRKLNGFRWIHISKVKNAGLPSIMLKIINKYLYLISV